MADKQPVLMLVRNPEKWGLERLGDHFDLRTVPGPGIRAAVTGSTEGMDAATMDALPDLEIVAVCAVGYDLTDVAHARRGVLWPPAGAAPMTHAPSIPESCVRVTCGRC